MNKVISNLISLLYGIGSLFILGFQQFAQADEFRVISPEPTPYENVQLNLHTHMFRTKNGTKANLPALTTNVGLLPDIQIHTLLPRLRLSVPKDGASQYGYGDIHTGLKYRFLHETKTLPSMALYPIFSFPMGNSSKGLGNRSWTGRFPLWMQKTWKDWKLTMGGGYEINPAKNHFNHLYGGILIRWQITKSLLLGNEVFAEEPRNLNNKSYVLYNFGGHYNFTPHTSVLFSAGHSFYGAKRFVAYLGLNYTWGPPPEK
ncbi:MAG: hypothetical protein BGO67_09695 [Alphaproteobacteria bacterium 41-28]|nr:MAG: hypothetical protein BGO67_09695 [Alphaproteobacteria bacterium 41-28]